jgi:hypothetical protein
VRVRDFEWDDGNALHIALRHGVEPEEAEKMFAIRPLFRKTRRGHYAYSVRRWRGVCSWLCLNGSRRGS